jgi:hypothetical protein
MVELDVLNPPAHHIKLCYVRVKQRLLHSVAAVRMCLLLQVEHQAAAASPLSAPHLLQQKHALARPRHCHLTMPGPLPAREQQLAPSAHSHAQLDTSAASPAAAPAAAHGTLPQAAALR